ncbi:MAG: DedA family protein [Balneolaceae bacterium]|nr:MAG: DedA family protein [Balneolaceae bacterium]
MESTLQNLIEWIAELNPLSIYLIFAVVAYLENVLPPIPGDLLVAFGGYLAAEQIIGFTPLLLYTTIFSVFGFMTMYAFGAYFGEKIDRQRKRFWLMRFLDIKYFDRVNRWMSRWGQGVILSNRFLAGTRSVISIAAGISRTNVNKTVVSSFISSLLWNTLLIGFGWIVNENWMTIGHYLNVYGWVIVSVLIVLVTIRFFYNRKRKSEKI